jgi:hypothetical protein
MLKQGVHKIKLDENRFLQLLSLLLSGLTNETSSGDMKRMKHFVTICLLGLLLLEVSQKELELILYL